MIELGLIGAGGITAHLHVPEIRHHPGLFHIRAVADPLPETRERAAAWGAAYYEDYRELLAEPAIDAVLVATPHDTHQEICVAALEAGKHVLVEKPLARTLDEADAIIAAAEQSGRILLVGHNERYIPAYAHIAELVHSGVLGPLFGARADHFQNVTGQGWWGSAQRVGGGCVIGSGIHRLDLLLWYLGAAKEVFAYQRDVPGRIEAESLCGATIRFNNGAIAEFFCNWGVFAYPYYESLSLFGERGMVCYDGKTLWLGRNNGSLEATVCSPVRDQWEHFAACIQWGERPLIGAAEARSALALVQAIYASASSGHPVAPETMRQ